MNRSIEQLKVALRQEQKLYEALLHLAEAKSRLVIQNNVQELEKLTEQERQFIREMSRFEQIRQSLLAHFAQEKELEEAPQNLSGLLLFLEENDRRELQDLQEQLGLLITQVGEKNQLNQTLIQQGLDFIQLNMELFTRSESTTSPYDRKADEEKKQKKQLFDAKF
ncbi:flagellar protein FlgN [Anoxynatronum sibiricum]|uniref:Flagellar protein FlgN n=1 Tax=Anoxynatronum sibiricum TaxID=210623 RepID=A0ABU9VUX8_9CLOT